MRFADLRLHIRIQVSPITQALSIASACADVCNCPHACSRSMRLANPVKHKLCIGHEAFPSPRYLQSDALARSASAKVAHLNVPPVVDEVVGEKNGEAKRVIFADGFERAAEPVDVNHAIVAGVRPPRHPDFNGVSFQPFFQATASGDRLGEAITSFKNSSARTALWKHLANGVLKDTVRVDSGMQLIRDPINNKLYVGQASS